MTVCSSHKRFSGASSLSPCSTSLWALPLAGIARQFRQLSPPQRGSPPCPQDRAIQAVEGAADVEEERHFLEEFTSMPYTAALMRPFILIAFGLQIIFGTTCMMQTASAQEFPPETMMTRAPFNPTNLHTGCHPEQEQQSQQRESKSQSGDLPCLGHCLTQATNRAVGVTTIQVPCPAMTVPTFDFSAATASEEITPCLSVFPNALSPPGTETIVLRQ